VEQKTALRGEVFILFFEKKLNEVRAKNHPFFLKNFL
jgi:hypothetical protein